MTYTQEIIDFIKQNETKSIADLAFTLSKRKSWPKQFILDQIHGRQKARKKYPFLLSIENYVFPPARAIEQSSSEITAIYKSNITKADHIIDLSGGMGIDSYFFSRQAQSVDYIEVNHDLFQLSSKNFEALNASNITTYQTDAKSFLEKNDKEYDLIYLDPDRRISGIKTFHLEDSEPNIKELMPLLWKRSDQLLLKLSPMLDIVSALGVLPNCVEVHVVAVDNDCKELLFLLRKNFQGEPILKTTNLRKGKKEIFQFTLEEENRLASNYSKPLNYLYEPNASILKAGAFKSIAEYFNLHKLAPNTHLYTSIKLIKDFPGRTIKVNESFKPKTSMLKQANVVRRNFPLSPEQLKKKYKIKDGGSNYLYACTLADNSKAFIVGEVI